MARHIVASTSEIPPGGNKVVEINGRDIVVFVTGGVIPLSLLVQGPLLPAITRWARLPADETAADEQRCDAPVDQPIECVGGSGGGAEAADAEQG